MGSGEIDKTAKAKEGKSPPATTTSQEPSHVATPGTPNQDWSGFQAYSPIPPHGFLASSPQAHPYMWGVQHIMPHYGTPPHPYVAMYPHGGVYAHPSLPPGSYPFGPFAMPSPNGVHDASANVPGSNESDGKPTEVKEKLPIKRSKGSLGSLNMITGKNNGAGKTSGVSANGVYSKSVESGSEGTSEGSDANSRSDSPTKSGGGEDSEAGGASRNGSSVHGSQNGGPSTQHSLANPNPAMAVPIATAGPTGVVPALPGPATNLNIGMDYWGSPTSSAMHGKRHSTSAARSRDLQSQPWVQDEREIKRQKRKQSNRESARRSRLRKQHVIGPQLPHQSITGCHSECDELAQRAEVLKGENDCLRSELNRIRTEYDQVLAENSTLKEILLDVSGHEDHDKTNLIKEAKPNGEI